MMRILGAILLASLSMVACQSSDRGAQARVPLDPVAPRQGAQAPAQPTATAEQTPRQIRMAIAAASGINAPVWVALDTGLFKKHGFDVEVTNTPNGGVSLAAMSANEIDITAVDGSTTAVFALQGAPVVVVATYLKTLVISLMVQPDITTPEQLRGKAVGITGRGTFMYTAARRALEHLNLEPDRDVALLPLGTVASLLPGLQANSVQAATLSYPSATVAKKAGFREMLDIGALSGDYAFTGITTTRIMVQQYPDWIRDYLKAIVEAIALIKRDPETTKRVLAKYLNLTDQEALDDTYRVYSVRFEQVPIPTADTFRGNIAEISPDHPEARQLDPNTFIEPRFVRELQQSGFIDQLAKSRGN